MGGAGSGRRAEKATTGAYLGLDVRSLAQGGYLMPGKAFLLAWTRNGENVGSISGEATEGGVIFSWRSRENSGEDWRDVRQAVRMERTPCNYGGGRAWFVCPYCGRRVGVLYMASSLHCRKCLGLTYQSQRETAHGRACARYHALAGRLGEGERRPKGMHRRTYERILAGMEKASGAMLGEVRRLLERVEGRRSGKK